MEQPGNDTPPRTLMVLVPAVAGTIVAVAGGAKALDELGVHSLALKILVVAGAVATLAVAGWATAVWVRWRRLKDLVTTDRPRAFCTVNRDAFGAPRSQLAIRLTRDVKEHGQAPYVPRDGDETLEARLTDEHRFVLLIGDKGSGKTRTAYELTRHAHGDRIVMIPREPWSRRGRPSDPGPEPLAALLETRLPPLFARRGCLLWIDDIDRYLEQSTVGAADLGAWLDAGRGRRIVATIRSRAYGELAGAAGTNGQRARGVLDAAAAHPMELDWSADEQRRVEERYDGVDAAATRQFSRYLSAYPVLERRCRTADEHSAGGAAIVRAAVAWHRAGMEKPIPRSMLRKLFVLHLQRRPGMSHDDLFAEGIEWATDPGDAPAALLERTTDAEPSFRAHHVAHKLMDEGRGPRRGVWTILREETDDPSELVAIANAALRWGELDVAAELNARAGNTPTDRYLQEAVQRTNNEIQLLRRERAMRTGGREIAREEAARAAADETAARWTRRPVRWLRAIDDRVVTKTAIRLLTLLLIDVVGLWLALMAAYLLVEPGFDDARRHVDARIPVVALLVVLLFSRAGLYRAQTRRGDYARLLAALTQAAIGILIVRAFSDAKLVPFSAIPLGLGFAFVFVGLGRVTQTWMVSELHRLALGRTPRRVLVGTRAQVAHVHATLARADHRRHDLVGWLSVDGSGGDAGGLQCLGPIDDVETVLVRYWLDEVVICDMGFSDALSARVVEAAWRSDAVVQVQALTRRRQFLVSASHYTPGSALPLEQLRMPELDPTQRTIKRGFDLVTATLGLVVLSPLLALTAFLVVATSKGPALRHVSVLGLNKRTFELLKFRIAYEDADSPDHTRHLTPLGRLLDRLAVDELPQLLNVLRGRMSLVGPRPLRMRKDDLSWEEPRFRVLPGLTGLWQISGRQDDDYADMMQLDLYYVQRWSFFLDLEILIKTVPAVLLGRRARFAIRRADPPNRG